MKSCEYFYTQCLFFIMKNEAKNYFVEFQNKVVLDPEVCKCDFFLGFIYLFINPYQFIVLHRLVLEK